MKMPAILPKVDGVCDACGGNLIHRSDDEEVRMVKGCSSLCGTE